MTDEQQMAAVLDLYQRLFAGENKDVTFELIDGQEKAHQVILEAASDVWKAMFGSGMLEKTQRVIKIPDMSCAAMRVFLRLLYTGLVDSTDWTTDEPEDSPLLPLDILLSVMKVAKRNMVTGVLSLTLHTVKARLELKSHEKDVAAFEKIFAFAIDEDVRPLLMVALEKAKTFDALKTKYDARQLSAQVQFELEAIWPMATRPTSKTSRLR